MIVCVSAASCVLCARLRRQVDMVAIPDFAAGAMENWGLITYRETALLVSEVGLFCVVS